MLTATSPEVQFLLQQHCILHFPYITMSEISTFKVHNDKFNSILGQFPTITLLSQNDAYPFAHEAGVYIKATKELFITSNRYTDPITKASRIQITRVDLSKDPVTCEEIDPKIPMGNGGVNYTNDAEILICSQGTKIEPSGLYTMSTTAPYSAKLLVADFLGRPFNSVNDVVVHSDGSIWFTDPIYGFEQGYRPEPQLPCQIYRYDPSDGSIRAIADGFGRPNGICFSPDERTVYITDTDRHHGDGSDVPFRVSSMYVLSLPG
jgi:gluconolactonase